MKPLTKAVALAAAGALVFTGCASSDNSSAPAGQEAADAPITVSAWNLSTTPEFPVLAEAYKAKTGTEVKFIDYDAAEYETLMVADMSANKAPDVITIKQAKFLQPWATGGQLADISDIASQLPSDLRGKDHFVVDGKSYAVPYRMDSWVLYYNKDMFKKAGVAEPDGTWTWDDYEKAAKDLSAKLGDTKGAYLHTWQSAVQAFASAQTPGASMLTGDFSYTKPYYERALRMQDDKSQVSYGTATTNKLTYQAQFGKQQAAMMLMGTWCAGTIVDQQKSGDADTFEWGMAPVPQATKADTAAPITFGSPTGMGLNPALVGTDREAKVKDFLKFLGSEDAAKALATVAKVASVSNDSVIEALFAYDGMPSDDLSKAALSKQKIEPEVPIDKNASTISGILADAHSAIMSESEDVDKALAEASERVKNEVA
ncbi:MAG: extracellular solute-binding protein [Propionibacteriaceae bacterium]|jgi:multiple sugar transport system substrate-binding protein|nr:extracellular solute-binding protein [Propionibacteriaceae bacterium]